MGTRIKICCIASIAEARLAVDAGAHALGLVSAMPSGPGVVADAEIREIVRAVPPGVASFLLTSRVEAGAIVEQQRQLGANTLQLVDRVEPAELRALRRLLPGVHLVQVVHVSGPESIEEAVALADLVDAILLDSGRPDAAVKEFGGTGRVHDWAVSVEIVRSVAKPVFLAGGLGPDNVAEAVRRVRPYGVDVCSGLRVQGRLQPDLLQRFVAAVASA